METFDVIEKRSSIRGYKDEQIADEELKKILNVANKAPNAGPFQVTVIQNQDILKEINDKTKEMMLASEGFMKERASIEGYEPLYGVPTMIVLSAPETPFTQINVASSATTMILAATDLGIGSCYAASVLPVLNNDYLEKLDIPEGFTAQTAIFLGYEGENQIPSPEREVPDNINYIK